METPRDPTDARAPYRSTLVFLFVMTIGGVALLNGTVDENVLTPFSLFITRMTQLLLSVFGLAAERQAQTLATLDHRFGMYISNNCNGAWAHLIFTACILAYPATGKEKLLGLVFGQIILLLLSIVRSATLFAVGVHAPSLFSAIHLYVWQFLLIAFALMLLFLWAEKVVAHPT